MKKVLVLIMLLFVSISLYAQKPLIKIYDIDGNETKYNIEDISEMNFEKSNMLYKMIVYREDTTNTYLTLNIKSMEFVDSNKIKINLLTNSKILYIGDIDNIIFVQDICSDVTIGIQTWMCKNLDVDHYRNGDSIPEVTDPIEWGNLKTGAWCNYNNDPALGAIYGKLYNWYAVNDPRGLAPEGWHIPNNNEWILLTEYLGNNNIAGGKLKSIGTMENGEGLWQKPNKGASNESGFSALPGGHRGYSGSFELIGYFGSWWSYAEFDSSQAWLYRVFNNDVASELFNYYKNFGLSVRCIRDDNTKYPKINSVSPNPVSIGDILTIKGENFGDNQDTNFVSFNSFKLKPNYYKSWSDTEIQIEVPKASVSGNISVTVSQNKSYDIPIEVNAETYQPKITMISSDTLSIGSFVTIVGSHFGTYQETDVVLFNDTKPKPTDYISWKDTEIKLKVPQAVTNGFLFVVVNGKKSNSMFFRINGDEQYGHTGDIDGNSYKTVKIGNQWWSRENLDVTHYRNGDLIPEEKDEHEWAKLKTGAWCYYTNDSKNGNIYGKLYNWYAVNDPRGLAPEGWHIPSAVEWTELVDYIGGVNMAPKLKDESSIYWNGGWSPQTNTSGFTALPGGNRDSTGACNNITKDCYIWSSSEYKSTKAISRNLNYFYTNIAIDNICKRSGLSVRFVRDEVNSIPKINTITPDSVSLGDELIINGEGFGAKRNSNFLSFNSIKPELSDYIKWSDKEIQVKVPKGSISGRLYITINGAKSNELVFIILNPVNPPKILQLSSDSLIKGDILTLTGENFGTFQRESYILFADMNPQQNDYLSWSDTVIKVKVPILGKSGKVSVTVNNKKSNELSYQIIDNIEYGTVTDIEGNVYKTVKILDRWWMAENLKVSHFKDGTAIPDFTNAHYGTSAWGYYDFDESLGAIYGKLYNWYAVNDPHGLAPEGWHIPSEEEWSALINDLGGQYIAGGKLKSTGTIENGDGLWKAPNEGATNETGFSALPAGSRQSDGDYWGINTNTHWWSSTEKPKDLASIASANYDNKISWNSKYDKIRGLSIRCIKDQEQGTHTIKSISTDSISIGDTLTIVGNGFGVTQSLNYIVINSVKIQKENYWSWSQKEIKLIIPKDTKTGKLYVVVNGTKSNAIDLSIVWKTGTMTDIDGNVYKTVKIGNQWWMAENLKVNRYRNKELIAQESAGTRWSEFTTGARCYYDNNIKNFEIYGNLYNGFAVKDPRGLAPAGWHIPTKEEFITLIEYLGGEYYAGGKMKSKGTIESGDGLWKSPNTDATNETGFSAMPSGSHSRSYYFEGIGNGFYLWSATPNGYAETYFFVANYNTSSFDSPGYNDNKNGYSVRCIKD